MLWWVFTKFSHKVDKNEKLIGWGKIGVDCWEEIREASLDDDDTKDGGRECGVHGVCCGVRVASKGSRDDGRLFGEWFFLLPQMMMMGGGCHIVCDEFN